MKILKGLNIKKHMKNVKVGLSKNTPDIYIGLGIVGVAVGSYLAIKAGKQAADIVNNVKEDIKFIDDSLEEVSEVTEEHIKEAEKEKIELKVKAGVELAKIISPVVITNVVTIAMFLKGHEMNKKRLLAVGAAYNALNLDYSKYRDRVKEKLGEKEELAIRHNTPIVTIEEKDDKTDKKKKTDGYDVSNKTEYSPFCKFFDATSPAWEKSATYNLTFLRAQQKMANDQLRNNGYLFVNDLYKNLGLEPIPEGQLFGWVYDADEDTTIDFGLYNIHDEAVRRFVNGVEPVVLLDFNVQGYILDKVPYRKR